jgi:hypothetical protein
VQFEQATMSKINIQRVKAGVLFFTLYLLISSQDL